MAPFDKQLHAGFVVDKIDMFLGSLSKGTFLNVAPIAGRRSRSKQQQNPVLFMV